MGRLTRALGPALTYPDIFESASFTFRIQKFPRPHVAYSNRIRRPHASDGIRIHSRETRPTRCAAILVYCSVRNWTRFCYVIGFENIRNHRRYVIGLVTDLFFSTLESGFTNIRIRRMRVDGSRIRKEKVANSKISGCVWKGPYTP